MALRPSDILKRLRGFSTPFGGVSWDVPEPSMDMARRVLRFLEDRRVLYNPYELEMPSHCEQSVIEIRRFLTSELGKTDDEELVPLLTAMRTACRKFLDQVQGTDLHHGFDGFWSPRSADGWIFISALGELRGVMGILVGQLATRYELDIEEDLAKILPDDPEASSDV